ncbi:hypothetical protein GCM10023321_81730 [Pseudonocardia eucalypti]|uniref:Uncharacterized protein n=1 Tax=Pseudonocardia eucalypti TaxID=648755 RepID=A0ABP9REI9_9PSEU
MVQLDPLVNVLVRAEGERVAVWARTPFEVFAWHAAPGSMRGPGVTVAARELLAGLAVGRSDEVEPGLPALGDWPAALPVEWTPAGRVVTSELDGLVARGLADAKEHGDHPPPELLDRPVLAVEPDPEATGEASTGRGGLVRVPMRCLFALSGLGIVGDAELSVADGWARLATSDGAVVFRRRALLPLAL